MKPIDECKTVAELLESSERWNRDGGWAKNANGETAYYADEDAQCFCIDGAIRRVYCKTDGIEAENAQYKLAEAAGLDIYGNGLDAIWLWNDASERTHAEVLEAVRKAGI